MTLATSDQVRAIQTARRRQGLDEPAYRDALAGFGVASTKALTVVQAATFLDRLNGGGTAVQGGRPARLRATGPFATKLQALWLSAWNLGVVRDRDDAALLAMVERQTGIPHTRFLLDPADAAKAIEAVKAMLVRDGGVVWPKRKGPGSIELKRAVVTAQIRRLAKHGLSGLALTIPADDQVPIDLSGSSGPELDAFSRRLGVALRDAFSRGGQ